MNGARRGPRRRSPWPRAALLLLLAVAAVWGAVWAGLLPADWIPGLGGSGAPATLAAGRPDDIAAAWGDPEPEAARQPLAPSPVGVGGEAPAGADLVAAARPLPSLDASDALVRALVREVARRPVAAAWLAPSHLVDRFVVAVDNVADGQLPTRALGFLRPATPFAARGGDPTWHVDPAGYARYDAFAELAAGLDAAEAVRAYRTLEPLLEESFGQLGRPDERFEQRLRAAADELLAAPIPESPPELVRHVKRFEYASPALADCSEPQKLLLRMGPANARTIQEALRRFLAALDAQA